MSRYSSEVLAIVPARSGSKSVPHKNIRTFAGKPLMAHSIEQALASGAVGRVLVSTDSAEYAEIARQHGAEAPFLRPAAISGDASTDLECFQHALGWLANSEDKVPELIVHLRPTHPNRRPSDIARAVALLCEHPEWDSVRSVVPAPETPFKMWFRSAAGELEPVIRSDIREAHSRPRQSLPSTFLQNANIDVIRTRTIIEKGSVAGTRIGSLLMEEFHDIDTPEQFARAEHAFVWSDGVPTGKTFVFDIDGVIATITPGNDYSLAGPLADNIRRINRLHDAGNTIILFTARGSATGINWSEVTHRQMAEWGVRHHRLMLGKPAADHYVDDKMMGLDTLAQLDNIH
jgi:CMP-N-acetylneuraminic acid synthetase